MTSPALPRASLGCRPGAGATRRRWGRGDRSRFAGVVLSSWLLATSVGYPTAAAAKPAAREYALKAAFLFSFAKFVEWPAEKLPTANAPIVIGILGPDPFGDELERVVEGRRIGAREIVIRRYETVAASRAAHLLFVSSYPEQSAAELRAALDGIGVLTVGESAPFAREGGIVTFSVDDGRLGFEINQGAAARANLHISAQLLKLAKQRATKPRS